MAQVAVWDELVAQVQMSAFGKRLHSSSQTRTKVSYIDEFFVDQNGRPP